MIIKEPRFWYEPKKGILPFLLLPFSLIFLMLGWVRSLFTPTKRIPIPVICVGNISVGGTGKTPTALKLASLLKDQGKQVHFLTKGYGGDLQGPALVRPGLHMYEDVGDEALLLAEMAPTWVSKNRYKGAEAAYKDGAEIIIMDDGFQNPSLYKDLNLVVVDGTRGFGNGFVMPAGPLREPLFEGLSRADGVIVVGGTMEQDFNKSTFKAKLTAPPPQLEYLRLHKYLAFCGIGNPSKFFKTLEENHIPVLETKAFPDHYDYKGVEVVNLLETARALGAKLITTKKDWVRLPVNLRDEIDVLEVEMEFEDEHELTSLLKKTERV